MDIKRSILWVIFTLSLVMLYDNWQRAHGQASLFASPVQTQPATSVGANSPADVPAAVTAPHVEATSAVGGVVSNVGEKVQITTDLYRAELDTAGGILSHLELLQQHEKDGSPVRLFDRSANRTYLARSGLIGGSSAEGELPNHTVIFSVQPGVRDLGSSNEVAVTMEAEKNGVKLLKTYVFKRGSYVVDVKFDVVNTNSTPVSPTLYLELARDNGEIDASHFYHTFTGPAVYTDGAKFQKVSFADIDKGKAKFAQEVAAGENGWVSMVQHYFASAWIPQTNGKREVYVNKIDANLYRIGLQQPLGTLAAGAQVSTSAKLFAGPQEERALEVITPGLELVKDYGWLTIIAKPLFWLLEKIHALVGNWGWAIILLTVLIKLVFFPLSAASYKSMAKMKELQPRLMAMRERHKGDPQKMNQAMMEMYRTEKVNPLGGCVPILIQIPVFIALYWVLLSSVEMRNAPWVGWIHDLSAPDPFYILPVLMAISMFVQTKLNPTPPDPMQAKIMLWMPLAFSVMFFFFPAGLVLYWVVNNVLSILQQAQINRMIKSHQKVIKAHS